MACVLLLPAAVNLPANVCSSYACVRHRHIRQCIFLAMLSLGIFFHVFLTHTDISLKCV